MIFARKMPEFYITIAWKIFFPNLFFFGGGARPSCPRLLRLCFCNLPTSAHRRLAQLLGRRTSRGDRLLPDGRARHPRPPPPRGQVPRPYPDRRLRGCGRRFAPARRPSLPLPRRQRHAAGDPCLDPAEQGVRGHGQGNEDWLLFACR